MTPKIADITFIRVGKKNIIYVNIFTTKGKLQAIIDNRSQINIILPKAVEWLGLPY